MRYRCLPVFLAVEGNWENNELKAPTVSYKLSLPAIERNVTILFVMCYFWAVFMVNVGDQQSTLAGKVNLPLPGT